jgi:two-component system chemotaxis response regulator CheB
VSVGGLLTPGARPALRSASPYQVMVVDDSATIRGLLTRALESDREIAVVASASDGEMALNTLARHEVEVIVLDIEMPRMDGLTAIPQLLAKRPGVQIVMASTLTRRNAEVSLKALAAGAADYVTKPGVSSLTSADEFKRELIFKVKSLALARRRNSGRTAPTVGIETRSTPAPAAAPRALVALRSVGSELPQAIAIASSTGGPQALFKVLGGMKGLKQPVFITQHMPPTFTTILAEHIQRMTGWPAHEATDGETPAAGCVHVAPGDFHMTVERTADGPRLRLAKSPPENFCRPAADPMLRSLVQVYGGRLLGVVLTGMGHDGLAGSRDLVAAGGTLIAQDEATSVVWGMPGAVAQAGLCSAVLPVGDIAAHVVKLASGKRS